MNETNTTTTICQAPNSFNFAVLPQFVEDIPLTSAPPSWHRAMKVLGLTQNEENCASPRACGVATIKVDRDDRWGEGPTYFCNRHTCPASRFKMTYFRVKQIARWQQCYWREVTDGSKYRTLRDMLGDWHIEFVGVPTDHDTVMVFTPEAITGSQLYTGGWYHFFSLIMAMPEHLRVRLPYARPTEEASEIAVGAGGAGPTVQSVNVETEESSLPLTPRKQRRGYLLAQWTEVEQAYLFIEAGFRCGLGPRGSVEIYYRDPVESAHIEYMLEDLTHAESQLVQSVRRYVEQELRSPNPAPWKELARVILERERQGQQTAS